MVKKLKKGRRGFLKAASAAGVGALAFPHLWIPRDVKAATAGFDSAKHLIYIRLSGGFRFPTAFNGDVSDEFNPFGLANSYAEGTEWGPSSLLAQDEWRTPEIADLGVPALTSVTNDIAVIGRVDHEPLSGSADGNHQTGLERYLTGYVNGPTGLFTMLNYGLRERVAAATAEGETLLPAIIMSESGMGRGSGKYAAFRPPMITGSDLDRFGFSVDDVLPPWAREMSEAYDDRHRSFVNSAHFGSVDAYVQSREATKAYSDIFRSEILRIQNNSDEAVDGISNRELELVFGDSGTARNIRLALRLFKFGCPGVFMNQGGYDYHSDEEENLPGRILELNQMLAGLNYALKKMQHPEGGTYWDHTIIALGSEFSRTTRGGRFNSARGSDHGGDFATRWMSMPFMGGPIAARGRMISQTAKDDLAPLGPRDYSYRSTFKSVLDALGADHAEFFPADDPFDDLFI